MAEKEWTVVEDEYGTWKVMGDVRIPHVPSSKYVSFKETLVDAPQAPTQEDFMFDIAYRVTMMEMGM